MTQYDELESLLREEMDNATREEQNIFLEKLRKEITSLFSSFEKKSEDSANKIVAAVQNIKIAVPAFEIPKATVDVHIPDIKIPTPEVTVNVPEIKVPEAKIHITHPDVVVPAPHVTLPPIQFPDRMDVGLRDITQVKPLPVQVINQPAQTKVMSISDIQSSIAASMIDSSGVPFSGSNPLPVTVSGGTSTSATNIVDSTGVAYTGSNPVPTTVVSFNGNTPATGTNETTNGVLRIIQMSDTVSSSNVVSSFEDHNSGPVSSNTLRVVHATDVGTSVNVINGSLPVTKSGIWAIDNPVGQGDSATALRVIVAGDSVTSTVINSGTITNLQQFNGNTPAQGLNETTPGVLRTIQMSDTVSSSNVVSSFEDHNSGPTGTNTLRVTMATDANSSVSAKEVPDATSTYAPSAYDSTAYETAKVVKASAGVVYSVSGYNSSTSAIFIQIHNAAAQPNDGVAPLIAPINVPGSSNFYWSSSEKFGKFFSTGITVLGSTTGPTKTLISDSSLWFDVQYQ